MVSYDVRMGAPHRIDSVGYHIPIVTLTLLLDGQRAASTGGDLLSVRRLEREGSASPANCGRAAATASPPPCATGEADTVAIPSGRSCGWLSGDLPRRCITPVLGRITYDLYDLERSELTKLATLRGILFRYHERPPVRTPLPRYA